MTDRIKFAGGGRVTGRSNFDYRNLSYCAYPIVRSEQTESEIEADEDDD